MSRYKIRFRDGCSLTTEDSRFEEEFEDLFKRPQSSRVFLKNSGIYLDFDQILYIAKVKEDIGD